MPIAIADVIPVTHAMAWAGCTPVSVIAIHALMRCSPITSAASGLASARAGSYGRVTRCSRIVQRVDYQDVAEPLIVPDRRALRISSVEARPGGAMPPPSSSVAAGVQ